MRINTHLAHMNKAYLFAEIAAKVSEYTRQNPGREIIRLGIGDVTRPITPHVAEAFAQSAQAMSTPEGFHGYPPYEGYDFLLDAIIQAEYAPLGVSVGRDELFVSDGAKSDTGNLQELLAPDALVAVTDPVYPVYVDSNAMAGRLGAHTKDGYERLITLPCTAENGFVPSMPEQAVDVLYLCSPNNPTGTALTYDQLRPIVQWANEHGALIVFDAAYKAYITEQNVPHSIFEIEGARTCAIECCSFSKNAGFTGVRCAYTVIPRELVAQTGEGPVRLNDLWRRRSESRSNGVSYPVQRAAAASLDETGRAETKALVDGYLRNASVIREGLQAAGFTCYGGVNSPYVWLKTPEGLDSWGFFDRLLKEAQVVGTPGAGFGAAGEGYFRLTAFNTEENTKRAVERIALAKSKM
ncbi:MAG: LL-diaminopimelate aminotransferase [Clostridia bacterium]|nr:LL-diaminopimelate aminotransferase [Clostridia bacterium]